MNFIDLNLSFEDVLQLLIDNDFQSEYLFSLLQMERKGNNRKSVIFAIRRALNDKKGLTVKSINSSIKASETRRRKRIVKQIYSKTSIWAMEEIKAVFPDYTEEMLYKDLQPIRKKKRTKEKDGYRYLQMKKIASILKDANYEGELVNKYSHLFARHLHNLNKPIICGVYREGKNYNFGFPANTAEYKVKNFITAVNNGESLGSLNNFYRAIMNNNQMLI